MQTNLNTYNDETHKLKMYLENEKSTSKLKNNNRG